VLVYVHHAIQKLGGVFDEPINPVEPPIEKPEAPTTPPSTEDLLTIKIEDDIMAVVGTNNWRAIAYGNGKYVAVGDNGYVTTSTDGVNWTTPIQKQSGISNWSKIVYGNGKFFAFTNYGYVTTSVDGITWADPVKSNLSGQMTNVAYGNGKLVALSYGGRASISTDGKTWTVTYTSSLNTTYNLIIYANNRFIALCGTYSICSTDGITWQENKISVGNSTDLAFGNNRYVLVGYGGTDGSVSISNDGITWSKINQSLGFRFLRIIYVRDTFVAIGQIFTGTNKYTNELYATTSKDGTTWTTLKQINDESGSTITTFPDAIIAVN